MSIWRRAGESFAGLARDGDPRCEGGVLLCDAGDEDGRSREEGDALWADESRGRGEARSGVQAAALRGPVGRSGVRDAGAVLGLSSCVVTTF